ncbi:hypothetical protein [Cellulomonas sp. PhB150]|uniref:hypothetical protein n=1 Tax=Cellulomonas sp. PhB150 TaxID=2485188 RepID=UPI000F4ADEF7|nr:hypothetical protein [Cellulomonas sp. PhB150]ROS28153.1 hypothetical protein EDF34_1955 [Cellulomonas sp. PhB150]
MARLHASGVALVAVLLLGAGTWSAVAHHETDRRESLAAARERDAAALIHLALPAGFTPVACEGSTGKYDRCWRVVALPDEAVDDAVRALSTAGGDDATRDCTASVAGWLMGCNARAGTVVLVATRDLNEAWTSRADVLADTSTLAIGRS